MMSSAPGRCDHDVAAVVAMLLVVTDVPMMLHVADVTVTYVFGRCVCGNDNSACLLSFLSMVDVTGRATE
jgi:hypothetical protein